MLHVSQVCCVSVSQTVQLLFLFYSSSTSFTSCTSSPTSCSSTSFIFTSSCSSSFQLLLLLPPSSSSYASCYSFSSTSSLSLSLRSWQPFFFSPPSPFHLISEGVPPVLSHGADAEQLVNFTDQEAV